jgi:hypothetical protein
MLFNRVKPSKKIAKTPEWRTGDKGGAPVLTNGLATSPALSVALGVTLGFTLVIGMYPEPFINIARQSISPFFFSPEFGS